MAEIISAVTVSSQTTVSKVQTSTTTLSSSQSCSSEGSHCRGPVDGSLYAKVNKSKRTENQNGDNHVSEVTPINLSDNRVLESRLSSENRELTSSSTSSNPRVVVLNGNRIIYKPQIDLGFDSRNIAAPLANLSEFNSSCVSLTSSNDSLPSYSSLTKVSVTLSLNPVSVSKRTSRKMADRTVQQPLSCEDDVQKLSVIPKSNRDVANPNARFSEISSCSATTLSSTSSEGDEFRQELSDHDSSDSSITDDQLNTLEGSISPATLKGNISPEILLEQALGDASTNSAEPKFFDSKTSVESEVKRFSESIPPALPEAVPLPPLTQGVMYNGGVVHGSYNKGPEYAVPMRDMKITTIPSKRAVLVSTGSEHDNMASPSSERRDSIYDEGNAYNGAGYATIDEYDADHHTEVVSHQKDEYSYIPEDVQELLNGLQEGPTSSDIDSGFHGSSVALQSHPRSPFEHNNVTSQSSSESFDGPVPSQLQSNEPSPTYEGNYPVGKILTHKSTPIPNPQASPYCNGVQALVTNEVEDQSFCNVGVASVTPKKNLNPGIPIPTQTLPEPQPAKVQIITMRNVFASEEGVPLNPVKQDSPKLDRTRVSNTLQTQPNAVEYQLEPTKVVEKPYPPQADPMETVTMRTKHIPMEMRSKISPLTENDNVMADSYFDGDIEDELDSESIRSVDEQIMHAQRHLTFLKEQQEKLVKRKQDRTKHRETLKRNSSAYERHSQGYLMTPGTYCTLPSQPYKPTEERRQELPQHPLTSAMERQQETRVVAKPAPQQQMMPPPANVNQSGGVCSPVQRQQHQNVWNATGPKPTRQMPDNSHDRNNQIQSHVSVEKVERQAQKSDKDDIIMSSDLQEQLAELDKCIAELTTSMDVPLSDVQDDASQDATATVVRRRKSFTLEIERKMNPNVPQEDLNASSVPHPPARSRSSFDSFKRLSQEFDSSARGKIFPDQVGNDDVFSPGPQTSRKKKQYPYPPQTSVTRRQHTAPAPPPKRRVSLEERLSPVLVQALVQNPGAKPKEDIHSYKEDLELTIHPDTPTFPLSPATPYTNTESPARAKSPPGLAKTPLSMLQLKPKEKPMEYLHHVESPEKKQEQLSAQASPAEDTVDGNVKAMRQRQQQTPQPVSEPTVQAAVAFQNGHVRETALLSDGAEEDPELQKMVLQQNFARSDRLVQRQLHQHNNGQNLKGWQADVSEVIPTKVEVQREAAAPPSHLVPPRSNLPSRALEGTLQQINAEHIQYPATPQQYLHNNSGASHSSHSPAATSSNSRHGSSDSLDGPSTRHSNSSVLSSSSSSSAQHLGMSMTTPGLMMSPSSTMRPGSQLSSYERHLLLPNVSGARSGDESVGSPQSGRTSSSSISDVEKMNYDVSHATVSAAPKFIRDTTAYWYKPDIAREQALAILRSKPAGSFIVRDSRCFPGAFGLALKVDKLPLNVQVKPGADLANEYVRHFLIEPSSRGVKLKGCPNEPVFGSLSALVYQHSITALALPCKLIIPTADQEIPQPGNTPRNSQPEPTTPAAPANTAADLLKQGAACNVIYIGSVDTESLTGPPAIERAIKDTYQIAKSNPNLTSIVHFKVSPQGITLTDNARKLFFRRHYPTDTVTFCGLDPMGGSNKGHKEKRRWDATAMRGGPDAWLFGFVARKQAGSRDNQCHVFAELDSAQPARAIVNFVTKILIGFSRQNSS